MRLDDAHVSPDPATVTGTVLSAQVTPREQQRLFLWEEGNVPAVTEDRGSGMDPVGFRPTVTSVPVPEGTDVKGAVLLCAGGAFIFRGDEADCYPTAEELVARGYQCFVVDYRLRPYTQAEGGVDLARATPSTTSSRRRWSSCVGWATPYVPVCSRAGRTASARLATGFPSSTPSCRTRSRAPSAAARTASTRTRRSSRATAMTSES